jgi:hypothetical protein
MNGLMAASSSGSSTSDDDSRMALMKCRSPSGSRRCSTLIMCVENGSPGTQCSGRFDQSKRTLRRIRRVSVVMQFHFRHWSLPDVLWRQPHAEDRGVSAAEVALPAAPINCSSTRSATNLLASRFRVEAWLKRVYLIRRHMCQGGTRSGRILYRPMSLGPRRAQPNAFAETLPTCRSS